MIKSWAMGKSDGKLGDDKKWAIMQKPDKKTSKKDKIVWHHNVVLIVPTCQGSSCCFHYCRVIRLLSNLLTGGKDFISSKVQNLWTHPETKIWTWISPTRRSNLWYNVLNCETLNKSGEEEEQNLFGSFRQFPLWYTYKHILCSYFKNYILAIIYIIIVLK